MLNRLVQFIQPIAVGMGGPGLLLLAFFDSSFLPLPEVPDLMLVVLASEHPAWWMYYAAMTTVGSVAGCFSLYTLARRGGEAMFRKRFKQSTFDKSVGLVRRYGLFAVIVPAVLPPPAPFKIFIILAGLSGISPSRFLAAALIGRGFRYFGEAFLAYRYGDHAMDFIDRNMAPVSLWLAAAIAAGGLVFMWWRRRGVTTAPRT